MNSAIGFIQAGAPHYGPCTQARANLDNQSRRIHFPRAAADLSP